MRLCRRDVLLGSLKSADSSWPRESCGWKCPSALRDGSSSFRHLSRQARQPEIRIRNEKSLAFSSLAFNSLAFIGRVSALETGRDLDADGGTPSITRLRIAGPKRVRRAAGRSARQPSWQVRPGGPGPPRGYATSMRPRRTDSTAHTLRRARVARPGRFGFRSGCGRLRRALRHASVSASPTVSSSTASRRTAVQP